MVSRGRTGDKTLSLHLENRQLLRKGGEGARHAEETMKGAGGTTQSITVQSEHINLLTCFSLTSLRGVTAAMTARLRQLEKAEKRPDKSPPRSPATPRLRL